MARSGRVESGTLKHSKFYVSWQVGETSIPENYHIINWQVGLNCGTSSQWDAWYSNAIKINSLSINGNTVISGNTYSNISGAGDHQIASGTLKIYHDVDGAKEFNINISGWLYSYGNTTGNQSFILDTLPRQASITSVADFNDEQNPTIGYSNPAGNNVSSLQACISLTGATDDIKYRDISKTGSSYTFNLTDEERTLLRNACITSNSRAIMFFVKTVIGGNTLYSTSTKTLTIVNNTPTIGSLSYKDNNPTTVAITDNEQRIIRNNSNLLFTIGSATPKKGATISKYQISISGITKERNSAGDINWGQLNYSSNVTATLKITDSRGNTATKDITIIVDNWELPTGIISLSRKNNFYSDTYLKVDGNCSSINGKNALSIKYRYKKTTDSSYSADETLSDNVQTTLNLDNNYQWNIQIIVSDKIGQTLYNAFVDRGMPITFFDRKKSSVGVGCFPKYTNGLEVTKLNLLDAPANFGSCRENTIANSYVKMFTFKMTATNKTTSIWFTLVDTQDTNGNALFNLVLHCDSSEITVNKFTYINNGTSALPSRIFAVKTGTNTIELYYKMNTSESPTITILSMTKMRQTSDTGKIELDCSTIVSALPSGTSISPTAMVSQAISLFDNSSGTTGNVQLSESAANFSYLELFYKNSNYNYGDSVKIYSPNGKGTNLKTTHVFSKSGTTIIDSRKVIISGTSISNSAGDNDDYGTWNSWDNSISATNRILITKVIGYR